MEPFIRSDQYNFIRVQTKMLVNGHLNVNDVDLLRVLKSLANEKVMHLFPDSNEEQAQLLSSISYIKDNAQAEVYLSQLKPYVIPFNEITEKMVKKLFPKVKKLKLPSFEHLDLKRTSYLAWDDKGSGKKYMVAWHNDKPIGLHGTFHSIGQKGVCTICNGIEPLGLYTVEKKGQIQGTYTSRGNYICQDNQKCNENLITLDKLADFMLRLKK